MTKIKKYCLTLYGDGWIDVYREFSDTPVKYDEIFPTVAKIIEDLPENVSYLSITVEPNSFEIKVDLADLEEEVQP